MAGITSYDHLDELLLEYMKNIDKEVTAKDIYEHITKTYKTNKIRLNVLKIAKRLKRYKEIKIIYRKRGICYYIYQERGD